MNQLKSLEALRSSSTQAIVQYFILCRDENTEKNILASENIILSRLIEQFNELESFCLYINEHFSQIERFELLRGLVSVCAFYNTDKLKKAREDKVKLIEANNKVAQKAFELADALKERDLLNNNSDFHTNTFYHIIDVIIDSSSENPLFQRHVEPQLSSTSGQYDLKYWPPMHNVIRSIAIDAKHSDINTSNSLTSAATNSQRASTKDTLRAFFQYFNGCEHQYPRMLNRIFNIPNKIYASIFNVSLALSMDNLFSDENIKQAKHSIKNEILERKFE